MQAPLFEDIAEVGPAPADASLVQLATRLPPSFRIGTSSWNYPGWAGTVWDREYPEAFVSKHGLAAYAKHPLFRTVSLDRNFYRPLAREQYAEYAAQVPADFRFVVKAPSIVADAMVRDQDGRGMRANEHFLSTERAIEDFVEPALDGLGQRLGALVFQLSPLPQPVSQALPETFEKLRAMLIALPDVRSSAPDAVIAVEVRDAEFLTPGFASLLREAGATYCLGLHAKMPPIARQLPILRALWPGPLVCRWNMNRLHGPYGYEDAEKRYEPYDRMLDPDPETRSALARVICGTTAAGHAAYVTISNKAEGSAPLSVAALAAEVETITR